VRGADRKPHAGVEQDGGKTAVHRAARVEVLAVRLDRNDNAPGRHLDHVITERAGHGIQGQSAIDQPLDELQAGQLFLLFDADGAVGLSATPD
jgi:hypothetical protein